MLLIPFRIARRSRGVPALARVPLAAGVLNGTVQAAQVLQRCDYFGFLPGDAPQWIFADDQGNALVTPNSLVDLGCRGEERVVSHPVEEGSFASVARPQELTLRLSCGGRNMDHDTCLAELGFLRTSLTPSVYLLLFTA